MEFSRQPKGGKRRNGASWIWMNNRHRREQISKAVHCACRFVNDLDGNSREQPYQPADAAGGNVNIKGGGAGGRPP